MSLWMNATDWCGNALFALSPEKGRLLRRIHESISSLGANQKETETHTKSVKKHSFDRYMIRMVASHLHLCAPYAIINVLEVASLRGSQRLAAVEERHFRVIREVDEVAGNEFLALDSYLSPEAMTVHRNRLLIQNYLLHNTDDLELVIPLLRDRRMWGYEEVMGMLPTVKSSATLSLSEGML